MEGSPERRQAVALDYISSILDFAYVIIICGNAVVLGHKSAGSELPEELCRADGLQTDSDPFTQPWCSHFRRSSRHRQLCFLDLLAET
jgi:hypothetical protein